MPGRPLRYSVVLQLWQPLAENNDEVAQCVMYDDYLWPSHPCLGDQALVGYVVPGVWIPPWRRSHRRLPIAAYEREGRRGESRGRVKIRGGDVQGEDESQKKRRRRRRRETKSKMVREGPSVTCISVATRGSGARFSHVARRMHESEKTGLCGHPCLGQSSRTDQRRWNANKTRPT